MIIHLIAALVYTFRVIAFFLWFADDTTKTRKQYYDWHTYSFAVLGSAGIAIVVMKWIEWGHYPLWTIVSWALNIGFNIYHVFSLKEFYELSPGAVIATAEVIALHDVVEDDSQMLVSKLSMNDLRKRAIEILSNSME